MDVSDTVTGGGVDYQRPDQSLYPGGEEPRLAALGQNEGKSLLLDSIEWLWPSLLYGEINLSESMAASQQQAIKKEEEIDGSPNSLVYIVYSLHPDLPPGIEAKRKTPINLCNACVFIYLKQWENSRIMVMRPPALMC